jgi:hypothetical protein
MKTRLTALALLSLATLLAAPASAQEMIKPGLYQVNSTISGNNKVGEMMKQQREALAKMTPEQRQQMADMPKQMEKMMEGMSPAQREKMKGMLGKQSGAMEAMQSMQMTHNADGSTSLKMCVTQAMIDQRGVMGQQPGCKTTSGKMTGGVMKTSYTCTTPPSKGEGEVRMTGPNSFSTKMRIVSANQETMEVNGTSTWLGASCGNVKPMDPATFQNSGK